MNKRIGKNILTKTQKEKFTRELTRENIQRMTYISVFVFILELIILLIPSKLFDYNIIIIYFLISNIALIPAIFFIRQKFDKISIYWAYIVQYTYMVSVMYLGVALALASQNQADFVHMYLMAVIAVASFFNLGCIDRTILIVSAQAIFAGMLPLFQADSGVIFVIVTNTVFFNIIAWVMSYMRLRSKYHTFLDKMKLEKMAHTDTMTNLYNHETILQILEKQTMKAKEEQVDLSIIMIDVDNFKEINDNFGHMIGDKIIKQLAEIINEVTEESDYVGRYGGDEFLIILPRADIKKAQKISNMLFERIKGLETKVTLSAGITQLGSETVNELVKNADNNLYRAKTLGKDRAIA